MYQPVENRTIVKQRGKKTINSPKMKPVKNCYMKSVKMWPTAIIIIMIDMTLTQQIEAAVRTALIQNTAHQMLIFQYFNGPKTNEWV